MIATFKAVISVWRLKSCNEMYGQTSLVFLYSLFYCMAQLAPIRWMCRSRQKSLRQSTSMYKQGLLHHHLVVCAEIDDPFKSKIILQLFVLTGAHNEVVSGRKPHYALLVLIMALFWNRLKTILTLTLTMKTQCCSIYLINYLGFCMTV